MIPFATRTYHPFLLSTLSGLLLIVSFPFTGSLFPLVFIAWIPLLMLQKQLAETKRKGFFLYSYWTFLIFNSGTTWWIWNSSEGGALMAFTCNSLVMAATMAIFSRLSKRFPSASGFIFIFTWLSFEFLHFNWDISWPWLTMGNYFARVPEIVQWYQFTGVLGGTLWILAMNVFLFRLLNGFTKRRAVVSIGVLVVPVLISLAQYYSWSESPDTIEVVVTQPNVDPFSKFGGSDDDQLNAILRLAESKQTPHTLLVLAPETALYPSQGIVENNFQFEQNFQRLQGIIQHWNGPGLLIGASTFHMYAKKHSFASRPLNDGSGYYESYNTSMLFSRNKFPEYVHKSKLVLGVEKLPFTKFLPFLENLSINLGGSSGTLGIEDRGPTVMKTGAVTFAPVVCYESIYGEFVAQQCRRKAGFIAVITNDGWWGNTPGHRQHFAFSRLRAIENRKAVARSANTGISGWINARGDVMDQTEYWKQDVRNYRIPLHYGTTVYEYTGDVLGYLAFMSLLIYWLRSLYERYRKLSVPK